MKLCLLAVAVTPHTSDKIIQNHLNVFERGEHFLVYYTLYMLSHLLEINFRIQV